MSRIGKLPITLPENVTVRFCHSMVTVKGIFGTLEASIPDNISIDQEGNILKVSLKPESESRKDRSLYGLIRTLINNMIIGVSEQFELTLVLRGVGYRAAVQDKNMVLNLGYSHSISMEVPTDVSVEVTQNITIKLKSSDKEALGLFASNIRSFRRPEPYKGKGILYQDEQITRKAGKSAK